MHAARLYIDKREHRKSEAMMSSKVLGTRPPAFLDLPPDELQFSRRLVALLDEIIQKYQPEAVFTQWIGDSHQDHYIY
jgi:N-acetylglucosamine malate deacetylase 1